jgi:hypothetical protein
VEAVAVVKDGKLVGSLSASELRGKRREAERQRNRVRETLRQR